MYLYVKGKGRIGKKKKKTVKLEVTRWKRV